MLLVASLPRRVADPLLFLSPMPCGVCRKGATELKSGIQQAGRSWGRRVNAFCAPGGGECAHRATVHAGVAAVQMVGGHGRHHAWLWSLGAGEREKIGVPAVKVGLCALRLVGTIPQHACVPLPVCRMCVCVFFLCE
jgi:hypothetical protein